VLPSNSPSKQLLCNCPVYRKDEICKLAQELKKLINTVGEGKLAIIVHDNPDPDAISSAMGLKEIANSVGVKADILYNGVIGHHENKAFVNSLKLK